MAHLTSRHDVVIVGGRCAGTATARLLAAQGHDVVVVERSDLAGDPLSTHGLARGGVVQLARWGLLDQVLASGAPPSREVTFGVEGRESTRPVKDRSGVDLLVANAALPAARGHPPRHASTAGSHAAGLHVWPSAPPLSGRGAACARSDWPGPTPRAACNPPPARCDTIARGNVRCRSAQGPVAPTPGP